ncbi:MAG: lysophospholipid acyltransferase family protein [Saprospiraceae bacterium]|nr:lysophospholipid acyltransferase family protein [Saprospiraceae bacterium]
MAACVYFLSLPFVYLISIQPFWVLYRLSDLVCFILFRMVGYRSSVVIANLRNSFPDKDDAEIRRICARFYQFFCDLIFETIKMLTISRRAVLRRMTFDGLPVFERYAQERQSVIVAMGHFGNWELAGARFSAEPIHDFCAIYKPLRNPYFDKLLLHSRTRNGSRMYKMNQALRDMVTDKDRLTATIFLADQTPNPARKTYWTTFLHQDTAMFTGIDQISRKYNMPVIYLSPRRTRRGNYNLHAEVIAERPRELPPFAIIERYVQALERDIYQHPALWLWTHRRWKRKRLPTASVPV